MAGGELRLGTTAIYMRTLTNINPNLSREIYSYMRTQINENQVAVRAKPHIFKILTSNRASTVGWNFGLKESGHHSRQADQIFGQAEDLVESMLMDAPNSTVETSLLGAMSDIYVQHFRLAALSLKNLNEAFEIVEQARGRALTDSLRRHKRWMEKNSAEENPAKAQI